MWQDVEFANRTTYGVLRPSTEYCRKGTYLVVGNLPASVLDWLKADWKTGRGRPDGTGTRRCSSRGLPLLVHPWSGGPSPRLV